MQTTWLKTLYTQGQDTQTYIMAEVDREGARRGSFLNSHQSSRVKVKLKQKNLFTEELQDIALQSKVSLISRKKIPEECNKGKFG